MSHDLFDLSSASCHCMPKIIVHVDGLCEPVNPGGTATYGYVVNNDASAGIVKRYGFVGQGPEMSNNVAEYAALCEALNFLVSEKLNLLPIEVRSDSRLLINQMKGDWKVRKGLYVHKHLEAKDLARRFDRITFKWIPREDNEEADALSRVAYSEATSLAKRRIDNRTFLQSLPKRGASSKDHLQIS